MSEFNSNNNHEFYYNPELVDDILHMASSRIPDFVVADLVDYNQPQELKYNDMSIVLTRSHYNLQDYSAAFLTGQDLPDYDCLSAVFDNDKFTRLVIGPDQDTGLMDSFDKPLQYDEYGLIRHLDTQYGEISVVEIIEGQEVMSLQKADPARTQEVIRLLMEAIDRPSN